MIIFTDINAAAMFHVQDMEVLQVEKTSVPRPSPRSFFETFLRVLITLSAGSAVVLSSISVCDGHWVSSPEQQLLGVWGTCGAQSACSTDMSSISRALVGVRTPLTLAVVLAIFGLELLMVSQLCDDGPSPRRWCMGSVLLLVAFLLSSAGTLTYIFLLRGFVAAFTLTFWCQFFATFLFFLNGVSGLYFHHLTQRGLEPLQPRHKGP